MCKNTFLIGITNPDCAIEFIHTIAPLMSKRNSDGVGYVSISPEGMFVERFLKNEDVFTSAVYDQVDITLANSLGGLVDKDLIKRQNETYLKNKTTQNENNLLTATSILLHTRKSTNKVCIENVHPFVIQDTALVHNGIISNHEDFLKEISSCDSEAILQQYLNLEVNDKPENITQVTESLEGYYACGVATKNLDNLQVIDVFKSNTAQLFVTSIPEIGGYCFSTDKDDILETIKLLGWDYKVAIFTVLPNIFSRFNATTGELMFQSVFKEKEREFIPVTPSRNVKTKTTYYNRSNHYNDDRDHIDTVVEYDLGIMYDIYAGLPEYLKAECDIIVCNELWNAAVWSRRNLSKNFAA